ncbi:hypothetical protein [Nonomuraea fuscirosea]|nr:hypothetical protein [Nonomuraea fuscirosea]
MSAVKGMNALVLPSWLGVGLAGDRDVGEAADEAGDGIAVALECFSFVGG